MGAPGPFSGVLLAVLGHLWVFVGRPGPSGVRSSVICWWSWVALAAYVRGLGPHVGGLGPLVVSMLGVLAAFGTSVGAPELCWPEKRQRR